MESIELRDFVEGLAEIIPELAEALSRMTSKELQELFQPESHQEQGAQPLLLDEPLSEQGLQPLLQPESFQPRAPPRRRRRRRSEILRQFDPIQPQNQTNETRYQDEIQNVFNVLSFEGVESTQGRRFKRWRFTRHLNQDHTGEFMRRLRENVGTSFYIRHVRAYRLRKKDTGEVRIFYKNQGSPWMNSLADAEKWLQQKETERLEREGTTSDDSTWEPAEEDNREDFSLDLKVVLDRSPLLGTGPLPDWLRNLAHGRAMVGLDTY